MPRPRASGSRAVSLDTLRAAGLALAALAANGIAAIFTVVFARVLGAEDYGSLAALVSTFLILSVPGSAVQVAVARETALGRLGGGPDVWLRVWAWTRILAVASVAITVAAALAREPIAAAIGVPDDAWAAAATVPTGCIWLLLAVQRGALQAIHALRPVGISIVAEALGRLVFGLVLVGLGLGVTGAYLGAPAAMLATGAVLTLVLRTRSHGVEPAPADHVPLRLRQLLAGAWAPVAALTLIAFLQNVDTILVKHRLSDTLAGSYAVAAVAGKLVLWIAIGLGLYLLPEAARRSAAGEDPRPVLVRTLALAAAIALPAIAIYAAIPHFLLATAFGDELTGASGALALLALAMSLLAGTYLCAQHFLAIARHGFLWILAVAAAVELPLLIAAGRDPAAIALALALLQGAAAVAMLAIALARRSGTRRDA